MEKIDLKKLNDIIEDYINYLNTREPNFLNNICFFYHLSLPLVTINESEYKFKKMYATDSFKILQEFYKKYYEDNMNCLENLFNSGGINVYYLDELKEEKIYVPRIRRLFWQKRKDNIDDINLPLRGNSNDLVATVHELRHALNQSEESRSISNHFLTEGLSMFDELLFLDFYRQFDEKESFLLKQFSLSNHVLSFPYVNFVCKLIILKDKLGYINLENYKNVFGESELDADINNCEQFLNCHETYKDIDAHVQNWYLFGVFMASFMHIEYLKNPEYLKKFKTLNESVRNNQNALECLKIVGIDLNNPDIINILRNSLSNEISNVEDYMKRNHLSLS